MHAIAAVSESNIARAEYKGWRKRGREYKISKKDNVVAFLCILNTTMHMHHCHILTTAFADEKLFQVHCVY